MKDLKKFLDDGISDFEGIVLKAKPWTSEELKDLKSKVGNNMTYIALLFFRDKQKEIEDYLIQKGYSPYAARAKEEESRFVRKKSGQTQDPKLN